MIARRVRNPRGGLRLAAFFSSATAASPRGGSVAPTAAGLLVAMILALPGCRRGPEIRIVRETAPGAPQPAPAAPPIPKDVPLSAAEARAVRAFLATRSGWRIASDADARPSDDADDLTPLYGVYHPYFVRGDLDDDGFLDFVAAFVDRGKPAASPWFSVAVFRGDGHGGFRPPEVIESEISLERGDLSVDRDAVVITPDLSQDDTTRRYRWDARTNRFEFVSGDDTSPDQTPSTRV